MESKFIKNNKVTKALINNMNAMAAKHLEENKRDRKKSSITSRMSPKMEQMFTLLAAKDWERKP
jgi:ribosomal protein S15P/S13E